MAKFVIGFSEIKTSRLQYFFKGAMAAFLLNKIG
jgi:hypothetical protein